MADTNPLRDPWLVAVWPGMGNVAVGAGAYLIAKLGAALVHELPPAGVFDLNHIDVKEGIARPGRLPRSMFFEWRHPRGDHDLLIFVGEAQPPLHGYQFCHRLLDYAHGRGIKRLFTFAAMATQLHPSNQPRVFGVATHPSSIDELRRAEVLLLKEGQISGLNGVLLAAGIERNIPGVSLLGELPFFAAGVPNPKASQAVLEVFAGMANIEIDFADLQRQGEAVERGLLQMLEKMQQAAKQQGESGEFTTPEFQSEESAEEEATRASAPSQTPALDPATRAKLEQMFRTANHDRTKAFQLKQELDRLGVFRQYEDRFLDLFKKAE